MDPNAAAAIMRDETADIEDRIDAAQDLSEWIHRGGFVQRIPKRDGTGYRTFGGHTAARQAALQEINGYLGQFRDQLVPASRERHPSNQ